MRNIVLSVITGLVLVVGLASCEALESVGKGVGDFFDGDTYAVVDATNPDATVSEVMDSPGDVPSVVFDAVMTVAKGFVPGLVGWEAMLALLFKRKRKHYVRAFKAVIPTDKNVDLGGAASAVGAALGMTHSSSSSEAAFEKEEKKA